MSAKLMTFVFVCGAMCARAQLNIPEDGRLTYTGLAAKYGRTAEEHDVTTNDGYILKLFRMKGDTNKPVLLIHGAIDTSDDFLLRGNRSLGIILARSGYDVWAINHRGNRYSRRHVTLDPDTDSAFWDFSMTEFGKQDLQAALDFIQQQTEAKISIIGYSEGSTSTFILGATKPEYNERINVAIAIAPVCYLHNAKQYLSTLIALAPHINKGLRSTRSEELVGYNSPIRSFMAHMCAMRISYDFCVMLGIFPLTGFNQKELEPDFLPILMGHFPGGTSRKNLNHFAQIGRSRTFADYDYGATRNIAVYGARKPPVFPLHKVTMKVVIFTARNDRISTLEDVSILRKQLPNVVQNIALKRADFNHLDFVMGRSSYKVVVPQILNVLEKYSQ